MTVRTILSEVATGRLRHFTVHRLLHRCEGHYQREERHTGTRQEVQHLDDLCESDLPLYRDIHRRDIRIVAILFADLLRAMAYVHVDHPVSLACTKLYQRHQCLRVL